jgi:hypothetical protein
MMAAYIGDPGKAGNRESGNTWPETQQQLTAFLDERLDHLVR